ncbi:MAG TPA: hypothetical protein VJH68_02900 [Candidatus Nanoarchaeia archaeon]|nr:hypothetical protein [Candidatus Nanoarchaeia archaeon]
MDTKGITKIMMGLLLAVLLLATSLFAYFFFFGPPVEEAECALGINWKILSVAGKEDLCYNQQKQEFRFTIENGVTVPLAGVYVKAGDKQDDFLEQTIEKAGAFIGKISVKEAAASIKIYPVVDLEGAATACLDEVIERNNVANCR